MPESDSRSFDGFYMPHPSRIKAPKASIPRFSNIVNSDAPAIQSPYAHENAPKSASVKREFNHRVAAYTLAFVGILLGGLYVGFMSREVMDNNAVSHRGIALTEATEGVRKHVYRSKNRRVSQGVFVTNGSLKMFRAKLLEQRERLEDQIILVRLQEENERRRKRPSI